MSLRYPLICMKPKAWWKTGCLADELAEEVHEGKQLRLGHRRYGFIIYMQP